MLAWRFVSTCSYIGLLGATGLFVDVAIYIGGFSICCMNEISPGKISNIHISQVLQKKFEEFRRDMNAGIERYTAANSLARRLVAEGHSDTVLIKEKQDVMR